MFKDKGKDVTQEDIYNECYPPTNSNKLIAEFMGYEVHPTYEDERHDLHYHTSWDWLMPVAEKCLTSDEKTDGQHYFINDALLTCNIEVVYDRVVEFIKEYDNGE